MPKHRKYSALMRFRWTSDEHEFASYKIVEIRLKAYAYKRKQFLAYGTRISALIHYNLFQRSIGA